MSKSDHLGTYAEGWTKGDAGTILAATANTFVFDDPNAGQIARGDFESFFAKLTETAELIRGGKSEANFMVLTEVATQEDDDVLTAWCWWAIPGTDIQGSGLI